VTKGRYRAGNRTHRPGPVRAVPGQRPAVAGPAGAPRRGRPFRGRHRGDLEDQ